MKRILLTAYFVIVAACLTSCRSTSVQYYNVIKGNLDVKSTEGNQFTANFLNDELQSYELTIYGEMGKSEYNFFTNNGSIFLIHTNTDYPESFTLDGAKKYTTKFVAKNDELLIYDYENKKIILSSLIDDEQQRVFNNALDFEQKIINGEFEED